MKKTPTLTDKLNNYYRKLQLIAGISLFVCCAVIVGCSSCLTQSKTARKSQSENANDCPCQ